jgi:hypothetical protein
VLVWLLETLAFLNAFTPNRISIDNIARLKILLPRILPKERPGLFNQTVAAMLVKSSGNEVTADNNTPPINAPDIFVVLSIKSTYFAALIDKRTTDVAKIA